MITLQWQFVLKIVITISLVHLTSDSTSMISLPAEGSSLQPKTSTGVDGGACWMGCPHSLNMARTLAQASPATSTAPFCSVPLWTITVASFLQKYFKFLGPQFSNRYITQNWTGFISTVIPFNMQWNVPVFKYVLFPLQKHSEPCGATTKFTQSIHLYTCNSTITR